MRASILILINMLLIVWVSVLLPLGSVSVAADDQAQSEPVDFTKFSLEELKNVKIISASKRPEIVWGAASAVYVITQEQIRRSGATSIPEALRLSPGVHVARISATAWAVNIRGLNNQFAENLLVLIDGRSVYTHVFSGVFRQRCHQYHHKERIRDPGRRGRGIGRQRGTDCQPPLWR